MSNHFTIAIDTCNHRDWIERCIGSCISQKYDNYDVILVDARSDDNTYELASQYSDKVKLFQNSFRIPQVANFVFLNDVCKDGSILVSVDGDDWLKNNKVLQTLDKVYSDDVWMTYGLYEEFPYRDVSSHYHPYPDSVIESNSFREYRWLASHLRTWRKELFSKIDLDDLKIDGRWLDTTGDQAIMLPMLEMAGNRSRYISDVMYTYNVSNVSRDTAGNESRQVELANLIRSRKKYNPLESLW